uniref:Uncharacterized protein n=1 Tax=Trichuris muris TaxID=70415 RepID=A0A5S6QJJ2_TRIMR
MPNVAFDQANQLCVIRKSRAYDQHSDELQAWNTADEPTPSPHKNEVESNLNGAPEERRPSSGENVRLRDPYGRGGLERPPLLGVQETELLERGVRSDGKMD